VKHVREVLIEVSVGELMDKITILEIKSERILDADKQQHVGGELSMLCVVRDRAVARTPELERCVAELKATNENLWSIEDEIRDCERRQDFGAQFVALARAVYRQNYRRCALKRTINELVGSRLVEEKSYAAYD
jgi:hypothetical protein